MAMEPSHCAVGKPEPAYQERPHAQAQWIELSFLDDIPPHQHQICFYGDSSAVKIWKL